ncbi:MAG: putative LytR family regulatory protein [Ilumatobacteraceae bacterium]|nr:putative LytR family regulatory protein [Ilumatobacteraceae bacterium]
MNHDEPDGSDLEARLRSRLRAATSDITPGPTMQTDIDRAARQHRRSRRLTTSGIAAAVVVVASAITFSATRASDRRELVTSHQEPPTNPSVVRTDTPSAVTNSSVPLPVVPESTSSLPSTTASPVTDGSIDASTAENTLIVSFTADTCQTSSTTEVDPATLSIQVLRTDLTTGRASLLGIPTNLVVKDRENATTTLGSIFAIDNPELLVDQIYVTFFIAIDHYVQLDQCAVGSLLDAVGSIAVPLPYAVRDAQTGLDVTEPGCHTFTSSDIAPYLTSTHLEYETAAGEWRTDPSGERGRIYRQFDFLRRLIATGVANGTLASWNAATVITGLEPNIVTDHNLLEADLIDQLDTVVAVPAADFGMYDFSGSVGTAGFTPDLASPNSHAIADLFRGRSVAGEEPVAIDVGIVPASSASCIPAVPSDDPSLPPVGSVPSDELPSLGGTDGSTHRKYTPVGKDGLVVGYVLTAELDAPPPTGSRFGSPVTIIDARGNPIGQVVDGTPQLDEP